MKNILMTSQQKIHTEQPNLWLEHIAQSRHITGQQEVGSRRKIPPLFGGSTCCFKYEELTDVWLDLTVIEAENEVLR